MSARPGSPDWPGCVCAKPSSFWVQDGKQMCATCQPPPRRTPPAGGWRKWRPTPVPVEEVCAAMTRIKRWGEGRTIWCTKSADGFRVGDKFTVHFAKNGPIDWRSDDAPMGRAVLSDEPILFAWAEAPDFFERFPEARKKKEHIEEIKRKYEAGESKSFYVGPSPNKVGFSAVDIFKLDLSTKKPKPHASDLAEDVR